MMFSACQEIRSSSRRILRSKWTRSAYQPHNSQYRPFTCSASSFSEDAPYKTSTDPKGEMSRTDRKVQIEYPPDYDLARSTPVQGRGGLHFKRTLDLFSLEGRVCVVTGGARGLGLVMSQGIVESGADVAIVDLNSMEAANMFCKELANRRSESAGEKQAAEIMDQFSKENPKGTRIPRVSAHYADVADPESVNASIEEIIKEHGKVDHLVTSAGFTENFDAVTYPYDRLKKIWGVNVDGTYLFATAVGRHLMERKAKGSIVMVGSMSAVIVNVPQPQAPYNASKAAVRQLAASLAVEWADAGIRVNCISPGYMLTPLYVECISTEDAISKIGYRTKKIMDENPEMRKQWTSLIPQGRMGDPADLMGAVVYLLSDAAGYVTGADLRIDGGYTIT